MSTEKNNNLWIEGMDWLNRIAFCIGLSKCKNVDMNDLRVVSLVFPEFWEIKIKKI